MDENNAAFSDAAYDHYDTSNGFGSAEDWIRAAQGHASGRDRYRAPRRNPFKTNHDDDMRLLGLTAMPANVKGLVTAMRKRAFIDHPDHGGTKVAFQMMFAAYERLLAWYPK